MKPNDLILTIDEQEIRLLSKQEVEAKLEQVATMTRICMTLKRPQAAPIANTIEKESTAGAKEGPLTVASPAPKATPSPSPLRAQPAVSVMNYITGEKRTDTLMMSRTSVVRINAIVHVYVVLTCYSIYSICARPSLRSSTRLAAQSADALARRCFQNGETSRFPTPRLRKRNWLKIFSSSTTNS